MQMVGYSVQRAFRMIINPAWFVCMDWKKKKRNEMKQNGNVSVFAVAFQLTACMSLMC